MYIMCTGYRLKSHNIIILENNLLAGRVYGLIMLVFCYSSNAPFFS